MRKLPGILLLVFGTLSATVASAEVAREDARALLERAGIAEQLTNFDATLQARLDGLLSDPTVQVPPRLMQQIIELFGSIIDAPRMLELLEYGLADELSQSDVVELNDFYDSPIARRIAAVEKSASSMAALDRIDESWDALEARLDRNPAREALLARLDRALRSSEVDAALAAAVFVGLLQGTTVASEEERERSYEVEFESYITEFLPRFEYDNLVSMIYTYGPITDNEIRKYLRFLHTPAAIKLYDAVELAQWQYYRDAGANLADALAGLVSDVIGESPTTGDKTPKPAKVTQKAARELLKRSGAAWRMSGYAADRERNAASLPYALDFWSVHPELKSSFVGLFRQMIDAGILIELAAYGLSDSLSEDDLAALNAFYASPLGKRIVALEIAAATQQAMNRVRDENAALVAQVENDPVRGLLLGELDKALRRSEADVSLAAAVYAGVGKALDRAEDRSSPFDDVFGTARRDFIEGVRAQQVPALAHAYGPLTNGDVLEYLRFLKSKSAQDFHLLLETTITVYLMEHGKKFAENFAKSWQPPMKSQ